ncbi:hypothetical protein MB46_07185 [Arthrobacter alpinus]|nr:hypothetical protein MB46_07185 [Arthrobacter alpinus]
MRRIGIAIAAIVVALAAGILLSPPIPANPVISALDRDATPSDTVPTAVPPFSSGEESTTRLLATHDGIRYFVTQTAGAASTCLTIYPDQQPSEWAAGCWNGADSGAELVRISVEGLIAAVLVPDNYDTSGLFREGFEGVQPNIYVMRPNSILGLQSRVT